MMNNEYASLTDDNPPSLVPFSKSTLNPLHERLNPKGQIVVTWTARIVSIIIVNGGVYSAVWSHPNQNQIANNKFTFHKRGKHQKSKIQKQTTARFFWAVNPKN